MNILSSALEKARQKADPRLHAGVHSLLYPGVLGSLMYALADTRAKSESAFNWSSDGLGVLLALALFAAFVADYLHSINDDAKARYSNGTCFADLLIVVLVFIAGQKVLGTPLLPALSEFWFLAGAKLCAVAWEGLTHPAPGNATTADAVTSPTPLETDVGFALAYLVIGVLAVSSKTAYHVALMLVLFADAWWYLAFKHGPGAPKAP
jgi:hypothetical protein